MSGSMLAPPIESGGFFRSRDQSSAPDEFPRERRGYWSFWIFIILFVLSLFAEFLANDKPLYVRFKGESYFPFLVTYPEATFLGDAGFLPGTNYRQAKVRAAINADGYMIMPPIPFGAQTRAALPMMPDLSRQMSAPTPPTWLLTDAQCKPAAEAIGGTGCADLRGTGSAPTVRAAMFWPASSTASASPCCSRCC